MDVALLGLLEFRRLEDGSAPIIVSLWLRTLRSELSLALCIFLPLLNVTGIMVLAIAWFAAVFVGIDYKRCLIFLATRRALRGWPSFAYHALLSISLSTSFMSGSYIEPFRLLRKYKVENGDTELSTQIVKKYGREVVVSQWMRRVFSTYHITSLTFLSAEIAMASFAMQNFAWKCKNSVIGTSAILEALTSSGLRNSQYLLLELSSPSSSKTSTSFLLKKSCNHCIWSPISHALERRDCQFIDSG